MATVPDWAYAVWDGAVGAAGSLIGAHQHGTTRGPQSCRFRLYAGGKLTTLSLDAEDIAVEVQPELKTFTRVGDVFADVRYHNLVFNNRDAGQPMLDLIEHDVFDSGRANQHDFSLQCLQRLPNEPHSDAELAG
jgi:hypothetical protein